MFKGHKYQLGGFKNFSICFAGHVGSFATVMYSQLEEHEKASMARRIKAALEFTRNMTLAELEAAAPPPATAHLTGILSESERIEALAIISKLQLLGASDEVILKSCLSIASMGYRNGYRDAPPREGKQIAWMCPMDPDAASAFTWARHDPAQRPPKCTTENCGHDKIPVWVACGT